GVELSIDAAAIANVSQTQPILQSGDQFLLALPALAHALVGNQAVGNLRERGLNSLLILHHHAVLFSLGQLHAGFQASRGKDRLSHFWNHAPRAVWAAE